jgi:hypothetical protein
LDAHTFFENSRKSLNKRLSARKLMATGLCDRKRGLMVQQGTTITSEVHCETPKSLLRAIQNKRLAMLTSDVVLLRDNASLRSSTVGAFQLRVV